MLSTRVSSLLRSMLVVAVHIDTVKLHHSYVLTQLSQVGVGCSDSEWHLSKFVMGVRAME